MNWFVFLRSTELFELQDILAYRMELDGVHVRAALEMVRKELRRRQREYVNLQAIPG